VEDRVEEGLEIDATETADRRQEDEGGIAALGTQASTP
jgi:hypothetical protein